MRTVTYLSMLSSVTRQMGWNPDNLDAREWHAAKEALSQALGEAWEEHTWPFLRQNKLRRFWPDWSDSPTQWVAGDFCFYPPTAKYYQALQVATGQEPATLSSGTWETNLEYWAEANRAWSADAWLATTLYDQGDVVFDPVTYSFFQCHTTPPLATLPTDTDYWGEVTNLVPTIRRVELGFQPLGVIVSVTDENAEAHRGARPIPWNEGSLGIQLLEPLAVQAWVRWLVRVPVLTGDIYDATLTYTVVNEDTTTDDTTPTPVVYKGDYPLFATIPLARAAIITGSRVDIASDENGRWGTFERGQSATWADDGARGFIDAAGTHFSRVSRE